MVISRTATCTPSGTKGSSPAGMSSSARVTAEIPEDGVAFAAAETRQTDAIRMKAQARRTEFSCADCTADSPEAPRFCPPRTG